MTPTLTLVPPASEPETTTGSELADIGPDNYDLASRRITGDVVYTTESGMVARAWKVVTLEGNLHGVTPRALCELRASGIPFVEVTP